MKNWVVVWCFSPFLSFLFALPPHSHLSSLVPQETFHLSSTFFTLFVLLYLVSDLVPTPLTRYLLFTQILKARGPHVK